MIAMQKTTHPFGLYHFFLYIFLLPPTPSAGFSSHLSSSLDSPVLPFRDLVSSL